MNGFQAPNHGNAVQSGNAIHQSGPNPQFAAQPSLLPLQPASHYLAYISQSVAKLSNSKVLELLACAAMYHVDVFSNVQAALSQQQSVEIQNSSAMVEKLISKCLYDHSTRTMAPPAQVYLQPQYAQPQYPPAQHDPAQHLPAQHLPAQHPQADHPQAQCLQPQYSRPSPDRDAHEKDEDNESEESSESSEDDGFSSFEASASNVRYILGIKYAGLRDSQQTHIIYEAYASVEEETQSIADAIRPSDSYNTKYRAMGALHRIGMMLVEPVGYLESEIVGRVGYSTVFVEAFQSLYDSMTGTERERISRDNLENLEQLDKLRRSYFEGFDGIVKQFREVLPQTQDEDSTKRSEVASIDLTS
jgi:hypothetical protein